jgi:AraC family transcriptional regulator
MNSRAEYERRMHRVLAHIDEHLDEPLDLPTLAGVACFSPFHFHRLFSAWMGETFGDYLRRRRIEVAARRLAAQPGMKVLNVALSVGFGSAEAFTRAFRHRFGCSPSAWRERHAAHGAADRNFDQVDRKTRKAAGAAFPDDEGLPTTAQEPSMQVSIVDRQPVTVAYLRHLGPYGPAIGRFWQETYIPWAVMNRLGPRHARYGISYDDPSITATGGALKATIPGGKYAVLRYQGTGERIGQAWSALLRNWLPASGLQLDARPCFEYYPEGAAFDPATGEFECEICIPVAPL